MLTSCFTTTTKYIGYGEDCMSPEAADLIRSLLMLNPKQRLGANGVDEIKKHKFFDSKF